MALLIKILITLILTLFTTGISGLALAYYNVRNNKLLNRYQNIGMTSILLGVITTLVMLTIVIWTK